MDRKYIALLALVVLAPIWYIANRKADLSTNAEFAKLKIELFNKEPWLKEKVKNSSLTIASDHRVGSILELSGDAQSPADLQAVKDWFQSAPPVFNDEQESKGLTIPTNTMLVRYLVRVADVDSATSATPSVKQTQ